MILMLTSVVGAAPFAYITNYGDTSMSIIDTATDNVTATVNNFITPGCPLSGGVAVTGAYIYVTESGYTEAAKPIGEVSVIDTATNNATTNISVGLGAHGVAVTPDGKKVYVTNEIKSDGLVYDNANVSVIDTATNMVTAVPVGQWPTGVAITPDGKNVYVANEVSNNVSVINTTTNTITATVTGLISPDGVAVSPDGTTVYVANLASNNVSVINTTTNTITANVSVGLIPEGIAVTSDRKKVYVTNYYSQGTVSVIDTATNMVTATVNVGTWPISIGQFIGKPAPTISWNNPADITYGTALSSTQLDATGSVPGTFVYTPSAGTLLSAGQNQQLNTTFTPNDTINYTTASANVSINITPATPIITWSKTPNIVYGTALGSNQLDATGSVPGPITYNPPPGTILSAGQQQQLTATLTPTDTANYTTASASVSINVMKATPTITWSNPVNIKYGTALSGTQLDATASVPGKFIYTPPSGTVLSAGTDTLTVSFTPTDTTNYTTPTPKTASITVTKVTPTITWNKPAYIVYGTALSSKQLDATSSVPGNFVYTPPLGTVLSTGTHTLTTSFKPTDTVDYTTASATASINVITPVQEINQMTTLIQNLVTSGKLSSVTGRPLISQLNAAKSNLNSGQTSKATTQLNIFIIEVDIYIDSGILSQTNGQLLINSANAIIQA
jgi:YVTN family beta-propeller protein